MIDNPFHANVTATEFQFRDKTKTYALKGKGGISFRGDSTNETGFFGTLRLEKNQGKFMYGAAENLYSDKFNPNDLGYLQRNNLSTTEAWIYYQIIEPFWIIRECNGDLWYNYNRIYNPNTLFDHEIGYDMMVRFKNNYTFMSDGRLSTNQYDYYEPRVTGRYYLNPSKLNINLYLNTDQRKSLNFAFRYGITTQPSVGHVEHDIDAQADLRIGHRFEINYGVSNINSLNERGYVDNNTTDNTISFSKRDVMTFINTLSTSYILNNKASLSLRARHYWSGVANSNYYLLQTDGSLVENPTYSENKDQNYNAFTIDMIFRWIFAHGSELSLAWKAISYSDENAVIYNYGTNFQKAWLNQTNSLSLKVLYYIDYNSLVKKSR